jgi:hypothetical protein
MLCDQFPNAELRSDGDPYHLCCATGFTPSSGYPIRTAVRRESNP